MLHNILNSNVTGYVSILLSVSAIIYTIQVGKQAEESN